MQMSKNIDSASMRSDSVVSFWGNDKIKSSTKFPLVKENGVWMKNDDIGNKERTSSFDSESSSEKDLDLLWTSKYETLDHGKSIDAA